jgi:hypothetical protein
MSTYFLLSIKHKLNIGIMTYSIISILILIGSFNTSLIGANQLDVLGKVGSTIHSNGHVLDEEHSAHDDDCYLVICVDDDGNATAACIPLDDEQIPNPNDPPPVPCTGCTDPCD